MNYNFEIKQKNDFYYVFKDGVDITPSITDKRTNYIKIFISPDTAKTVYMFGLNKTKGWLCYKYENDTFINIPFNNDIETEIIVSIDYFLSGESNFIILDTLYELKDNKFEKRIYDFIAGTFPVKNDIFHNPNGNLLFSDGTKNYLLNNNTVYRVMSDFMLSEILILYRADYNYHMLYFFNSETGEVEKYLTYSKQDKEYGYYEDYKKIGIGGGEILEKGNFYYIIVFLPRATEFQQYQLIAVSKKDFNKKYKILSGKQITFEMDDFLSVVDSDDYGMIYVYRKSNWIPLFSPSNKFIQEYKIKNSSMRINIEKNTEDLYSVYLDKRIFSYTKSIHKLLYVGKSTTYIFNTKIIIYNGNLLYIPTKKETFEYSKKYIQKILKFSNAEYYIYSKICNFY